MASRDKRLDTNVAGDVFVDETCIDCGTCRWMAPRSFDRYGKHSRVYRQPATDEERRKALKALVSCPTGSIGTMDKVDLKPIVASFPDPIADGVYHCGFHHESSFGAASYLIVREAGNVLVDSPRFQRKLVRRIDELGGVKTMFLTHKDDIAEHERFRAHFGCSRILHADDVEQGTRAVEHKLTGTDPIALDDELLAIPVAGHTRGSVCLLYRGRILFGGDHVAYSLRLGHVYSFHRACWYDWHEQIASMERLAEHRFVRILPGHAAPCHFNHRTMAAQMQQCIAWMRSVAHLSNA